MHNLLSVGVACEDSGGIPCRRRGIPIFRHSRAHRRVRASVHAIWHRIFDIIWGGEPDGDHVLVRVHIDDGTLLEHCFADLPTMLTGFQCVSPQILILRVAEERAQQRDSTKSSASMILFSASRRDTYGSSRSSDPEW